MTEILSTSALSWRAAVTAQRSKYMFKKCWFLDARHAVQRVVDTVSLVHVEEQLHR